MFRTLLSGFVAFCALFAVSVVPAARASTAAVGTAQVRQVPAINGGATVEGSIHMMTGGVVNLNGGAIITGDLLVPGTPTVRLNGNPVYGGTLDGTGAASPSNYTITLNGNARLGHVIRRTAPLTLLPVPVPPASAGTRSVTLNQTGQAIGPWNTLRNLTLNGNVGQVTVPPGTYGDFTASGGTGFTLGTTGATQPAVYNFQRLNLNGQSHIQVLGPVIINVANGFSANGQVGATAQPGWLALNIASGGFTLNGGSSLYGTLNAPSGTVIVNGNSRLVGGLVANALIVNGGGLLRLEQGGGGEPINSAPVAGSQDLSTLEDSALAVVLAATDADGDALVYTVITPPSHGTLSGAAPNLTYTPTADYHGPDSLTFRVNDGEADSNLATVSLTVTPVNDAPSAAPQSPATAEDTSLDLTLTGTDIDGDALTYTIAVPPAHGSLSGTPPQVTYTPVADYHGPDAFTFTVSDSSSSFSSAVVQIEVTPVNDAPVAQAAAYSVDDGQTLPIVLAATDADGDSLTYAVVSSPAQGTLSGDAPNLVYTPPANTDTLVEFAFIASDGTVPSAPATIVIAVHNLPDAPVAQSQSRILAEDTSLALTLVATDPDGGPLSYEIVVPPAYGMLSGTPPALTYVPDPDFHDADSFTFVARDAGLESAPATVSLTVTPVNDAPVATPADLEATEDTPLTFTLAGRDPDGDALTYTVTTPPAHGTLNGEGPNFTYTPVADHHGADTFAFAVSDGTLVSEPVAVTLAIAPVNDVPIMTARDLDTAEDTPFALTLSGSDADGDALTYGVFSQPAHGTLAGTAPDLVYTPDADYHGSDEFTVIASDAVASSTPVAVRLDITPVNDAPVAHGQNFAVNEGATLALDLIADDVDGDPITYTVLTAPAEGTLTLADGSAIPSFPYSLISSSLRYTPPANASVVTSFTFRANDGAADSAPATIEITVTNLNDAPVASPAAHELAEDTSLTFTLPATDPDGNALVYAVATPPEHGAVTLDGALATYAPAENFHGPDTFTFIADDGALISSAATVSLTVTPVNDAPVAAPLAVQTDEDIPASLLLTGTDADGDALTYEIVVSPTRGTLSGLPPALTYTPAPDLHGFDTFTYLVRDGSVPSAPVAVTLEVSSVNDRPVALPRFLAVTEGDTLRIALAATDTDGDALTFAVSAPPALGTLEPAPESTPAAPVYLYTPPANTTATTSFTFTASDAALTSLPATVAIAIANLNDAPVAVPAAGELDEDGSIVLALAATDADGDALAYAIAAPPAHGAVTLAGNLATYVPAANYHGADSFAFVASDDGDPSLVSAPAEVSLVVRPVNDAPVATPPTDLFTPEDSALTFTLGGTDIDGDSLVCAVVTPPTHGTVTLAGNLATYTPAADYHGPDTFAFTVTDPSGAASAPLVVSLTVTPVNDAPVAQTAAYVVSEGQTLPLVLMATDADGDALSYTLTSAPAAGTLSGTAPDLVYTPPANSDTSVTFTFTAADGAATSVPATVTIEVRNIPEAPVAQAQALSLDEDTPLALTLAATDPENDILTYEVTVAPTNGTLSGIAPALTYTPNTDFFGTDTFTFVARDAALESAPAVVALVVAPVNDAPVATAESLATAEDTALILTLAATDADGDPLSYAVTTAPAHGVLTLVDGSAIPSFPYSLTPSSPPQLVYTPASDYNGSDSVSFTVTDPSSVSSGSASIALTVTPVNDAPVAVAQSRDTVEDTALALTLTGTDVEGDSLAYAITAAPTHGTLTLADGSVIPSFPYSLTPSSSPQLTYTPNVDYHGTDAFAFTAEDSSAASSPALVEIVVTPVNDAPTTADQTLSLAEDEPASLVLQAADVDGDALTFFLGEPATGNVVIAWNNLALDAVRLASRPVAQGGGGQAPPEISRALAIVQLAVFEALNAIDRTYAPYDATYLQPSGPVSSEAAAAQAAHDALYAFFPASRPLFASRLTQDLAAVSDPSLRDRGVALGSAAAARLLALRAADGAFAASSYAPRPPGTIGAWQPADVALWGTPNGGALRPEWGSVTPFVLASADQFAPPAPPAVGSPEYAAAYSEVKTLGASTSPVRTPDQTETAYYWADGPGTYSPPGHWNAIATRVAARSDLSALATARLLALVNLANADAAIACWHSKFVHDFWRPVTAIRHPDDGSALTEADSVWSPLLGTPQFPTYVSGHSTFSAASAAVLGGILGDAVRVTVPSEDSRAATRVLHSLAAAAEEAGRSRVLGGIHYEFDNVAGRELGRAIGGYVLAHALLPVGPEAPVSIQRGEAVLDGATLTYTPPAHYHGTDTVPFVVTDGQASASARVLVTVSSVNDLPLAQAQAISLLEDTSVVVTLAATDADGDPLAYAISTPPAHGTLSEAGGSPILSFPHSLTPSSLAALTYVPAPDYSGPDEFSFTADDASGPSAPAAVRFTVLPVNDAPVATAQAVSTSHYTPLPVTLTGIDADADALTFTIITQPAHGTLERVTGGYVYRPRYAFWGSDGFTFTASDGTQPSAPAAVSIAVTEPTSAVVPIVSLAPISPAPLPHTAFALRATALDADGTVARVEFYEGSTLLGTLTAAEPGEPGVYSCLLSSGRPAGTYAFTAKVYDDQELSSVSAPLSVTLANDPRARTYTSTADFEEGQIRTLRSESDQLTTSFFPSAYDFVWVVNSSKGTVVRLDSETARVVGEYRSGPQGTAGFPSRIAIDSRGNAFVANRQTGTIVKIGLGLDNGTWTDRDGDRQLDTSTGLDELLAWPSGGQPADEQIVLVIETGVTGLDHIALDADDNLWVGPYSNTWVLFDGNTGAVLRTEPDAPGLGGRGGFVDEDGIQVSAGPGFLRWDTAQPLIASASPAFSTAVRRNAWGVTKDFDGNYWVTEDWSGLIDKHAPDGTKLGSFYHGEPWAQGVTTGKDGHIWVAHSHCGYTVGHLLPDGTLLGNVRVANHGPTEVAADRKGRIWVVSTTGVVERINPLGGPLGADGVTPVGEVELRSPNLGGTLWTFGTFVGNRSGLFLQDGEWRFAYDGQLAGSAWGPVQWNAFLYNDAFLRVEVALSDDGLNYGPWQTLTLAAPVPTGAGRHLRGRVTLTPATTGESPTLYDLTVGTQGYAAPEPPRYWRVSAGDDIDANWPDTIQLKGAFGRSDHAFPAQPAYQWSLVSFTPFPAGSTGTAPDGGVPTFSDPANPRATVTFNGVGDYVLRLTATLDGVVSTDEVRLHVTPFNKTPFVSAGEHVYLRDAADSVTLSGTARDDGLPLPAQLTLQWEKLFGPGNVAFTAPNAAVTDASFTAPGIYVLRLTGHDGEFSHSSTVTAWVGLVCRPATPAGLVAWWQGNADGADHVGGHQAFAENGAIFAAGQVGPAFDFEGVNDRFLVFGTPTLDVGASAGAGFGLEFWIRPTESREATILQYGRNATTSGLTVRQSGTSLVVNYRETSGLNHEIAIASALPANTWTHLAINYDRPTGLATVHRNGASVGNLALGNVVLDTRNDLRIGGNWAGAAPFKGQIDELSLYDRALRLAETWNIQAAGTGGKRPPTTNTAPVVSTGPAEVYHLIGAERTLALQGTVTDDGLPAGLGLNSRWTLLAAPVVTASPLTYATANFTDATSPASAVTFSHPGLYTLQLEADDGTVCTKKTVDVRVSLSAAAEIPPGLVAWWPGNHANREVLQNRDETGVNVTFGTGRVGGSYEFHETQNRHVLVTPTAGQTDIGNFAAGFTFETWIRRDINDGTTRRVLSWANGATELGMYAFVNFGSLWLTNGTGSWEIALNNSQWHHVAFAYDRAAATLRTYRDGVLLQQHTVGPAAAAAFVGKTGGDLYFGSLPFQTAAERFRGGLDELSFYDRPLTGTEVSALYNADTQGKHVPSANLPPAVTAGPDRTVLAVGGSATLQGEVSDDGLPAGSLTIQWTQVFGPGTATATLASPGAAQTSATFPSAGLYGFKLTATDGLLTRGDVVEVRVATASAAEIPPGLVAWWPGNHANREVLQDRDETGVNVTFGTGRVGGSYEFHEAQNRHVLATPAAGRTDIGNFAAGFTIETWIRRDTNSSGNRRVLSWANGVTELGMSVFVNFGSLWLTNGTDNWNVALNNSQWHHVAFVYDRAAGFLRIYRDGALIQHYTVGPAAAAAFAGKTYGDLYFGGLPSLGSPERFRGGLDELSFYNRPLTGAEVSALYNADTQGKHLPSANLPPVVTAGPDKTVSAAGGSTILQGQVSDDGLPAGYLNTQWSQVFGPATATLASPAAAQTSATFPAVGLYGFKLTATDGLLTRSDVVEVRVATNSTAAIPPGLVAWWPANQANREVVQNRDETGVNVTFGTGKVGGSYEFHEAQNRHVLATPAAGRTDIGNFAAGFTLETWIRRDSNSSGSRRVLSWANGATESGMYAFINFGSLWLTNGTGSWEIALNTQWQHVAFVYDRPGSTLRTYRDGALVLQHTVSAAAAAAFAGKTDGDLYFGGLPFLTSAERLRGGLDELSFYNRPLTPAEINSIFTAGVQGKTPLPPPNQPPSAQLTAPSDGATLFVGDPLTLSALAVDPDGSVASVAFYDGATLLGTVTEPTPAGSSTFSFNLNAGLSFGSHVLTAVATDAGGLSATSAAVTVTVVYAPPAVAVLEPAAGATVPAFLPLTLRASASYTGGPLAKVEFFVGTTKLGEATSADVATGNYLVTVSAGLAAGAHSLTAKATAVDGAARVSVPVSVTAQLVPPSVAIYEPADGGFVPAASSFEIAARVTAGSGAVTKVEFFRGSTRLGQQTLPAAGDPTTYFWPLAGGLPVGTYTFIAKATDSRGSVTTSAPATVNVVADPGPPDLELFTPADSARVAAPTDCLGVIRGSLLASWKLEYRLKPAEGAPDTAWVSFATGSGDVGTPAAGTTPAVPGPLGTFDPTLLLNGIYELRLTATDVVRRTFVAGPVPVLVEGNMKVGAFSVAFNDLVEQTPGLPLTLTRTYDSRDRRTGDFGPGWHLSLGNIRVQKNRHLGNGWWQTPSSGELGFQSHFVEPIDQRVVTVVMPDGETHRFRGGAYVKTRTFDDDNESFPSPAREGSYRFYPLGDTTSALEPITLDSAGEPVLADRFWIDGTGDQDLYVGNYKDTDASGFPAPYNPTRFRLTTADGTVMLLDQALGLLELRDRNGNRLVVHRDGQNRITSVDSTHSLNPSLPATVTIHRDGSGRVDYLTDLAGRTLDYLYDPQGRLASFTDREDNTTQFRYEKSDAPAHPLFHYLTKIIDPRGLPALRCEYDDAGRLQKQIDADGRETVFDRGIDPGSGRYERITDRLGHPTTYFYDERGNVTSKIDALGAVTSYDYYPDSDRVKFEEDHYGNVKGFAYDARGNVTTEILGASRSEEPATATAGHITRTTYTGFSAPLSITDPDGRVQSFTYDPTTQQLLTHTVGQLAVGAHAEIEAAPAATTTYTYHPDGTLWTVTDALGNVTTTTYAYGFTDAAYPGAVKRVITTVVDPAGAPGSDPANASATTLRTTYSYHDAQENLLATVTPRTLADGSVESAPTRHVYDTENRLRFTLMADGRITETRYTSFGQTDKTLEWPVGTALATLVAAGPSGPTAGARVTAMSYDARGNLERTTLPDGTFTATGYDLEGRALWQQDARGYRTFTVYDEVGRPRYTLAPDTDDGTFDAAPATADDSRLANNPRIETRYDLTGRVRFQIDERGATTETRYFADGTPDAGRREKLVQHLDATELVTTYAYYPSGQVRAVTDPRNNTIGTRYDSHGRPVRSLLPATDEHPATETRTTYNALGQRIATTDQEGKITRQRHDALGRLVEVRQYLDQSLALSDVNFNLSTSTANLVSTRFAYDEAGNQIAQTDARDHVTRYEHDALGRRLKRFLPATSGQPVFEQLRYDPWGDLWQRDDFAGRTTTFGYDALHRLRSKQADAAHPSLIHAHAIARVEYDYDDNGAREAARTYNASGTLLYTETTPRDERGRIDYKDTGASGTRLDYDYYANGLLKDTVSSTSGGVNVGYRYDEQNRLAFVDDASRGLPVCTSAYAYNANGSLEAVTYANGLRHAYVYDTQNRLRGLSVGQAAGLAAPSLTTVLQSYDYRLRASGHRREVLEGAAPSAPARTVNYAYDDLYRLTGETISGDPLHSGTVGYTLDKVGNREARTSSVLSVPSVVNSAFNPRDQLSTDSYDANGNTLTSPSVFSPDEYDFEDRLIVRHRPDGSTVNLNYDADGIRTRKTILDASAGLVSSTSYLVCTNNLTGYAQILEERITDATGTTSKTYTYGQDLLSVSESSTSTSTFNTRYYAYDGGGSVRALTDETGAITDRYTYDAFGVLLEHVGASDNAYLYRGEQWDADLGLYYLRARFMNPDCGRFWSQDTYEGSSGDPASLHKYLYAHANPVMGFDPSGHLTLNEYAMIGMYVHNIIGMDFVRGAPADRYHNSTSIQVILEDIVSVLDEDDGALRPDLVDTATKEAYEIKPERSLRAARKQLQRYIDVFGDAGQVYSPGTTYTTPPSPIPIPMFPEYIVTTRYAEPGVILYKLSKRQPVPQPSYVYSFAVVPDGQREFGRVASRAVSVATYGVAAAIAGNILLRASMRAAF